SAVFSDSGCSTGMPASSAACLTGLGASLRPRPAGRSGCVYTAMTSASASTHARNPGTAKSGVPAKTSRKRGADIGTSARVAPLLLQLAQQQRAFQRRQVIDEDLADQMVHLVLDAHGEQAIGFEFERLAGDVLRAHADPLLAFDVGIHAGERQAAFLADFGAAGF